MHLTMRQSAPERHAGIQRLSSAWVAGRNTVGPSGYSHVPTSACRKRRAVRSIKRTSSAAWAGQKPGFC